jgi:hypothetical protein
MLVIRSTFDVPMTAENWEVARAFANPPDMAVIARGDYRSAQGVVSTGGERIGTIRTSNCSVMAHWQ